MILWCISGMRSYAVLHGSLSVRCSSRGWVRRRCCRHKEGRRGWRQLDEVSDYSTSSGTGSGFWMPFGSALFMEPHLWNTSFPIFSAPLSMLPPPRRLFLSPSSLIGGAVKLYGVSASSRWGPVCVSHWRPPPSDASPTGCACCSQLPNFCFVHKSHSPKSTVCTSNNLT